jgi:4-diphosphocytidyl-2-C-methyl-D-erythritol kinase
MRLLCPAKINLFLKVIGKKSCYHELESLLVFTDLVDVLEIKKSDNLKLEISGEFADLVDEKENLFTKILDFFGREFGVEKKIHIKLQKNIPVGGGLGGGSSNAAYFMKALNEIFLLNFSKEKLQEISFNFGSDIAFFFEDHASIIKGRGQVDANFPVFSPISALLINPKIFLSTKEVFEKFSDNSKGNFSHEIPTKTLLQENVFDLIKNLPNDLEKPAITRVPVIGKILSELEKNGADFAKMSGSGATCFGIFLNEEKLENAEKELRQKFPDFFMKRIKILSNPLQYSLN